jgi:hypothetical protein
MVGFARSVGLAVAAGLLMRYVVGLHSVAWLAWLVPAIALSVVLLAPRKHLRAWIFLAG